MIGRLTKGILGAALLSAAVSVHAVPIRGQLDITGISTLTGGTCPACNPDTATGVSHSAPLVIIINTLDFGAVDTVDAYNPITYSPITTPIDPLFVVSESGSGETFTFVLDSFSIDEIDNNSLVLLGQGTMSTTKAGFDDTLFNWQYTRQGSVASTSFSSTVLPVPEPGVLGLLGLALTGLAGLRMRSGKKS